MKRIKQSVAVAIFDPSDRNRLLCVQRPGNDRDLPNVWGLPASSLMVGESFEDAVLRTGREKLGVSLAAVHEWARASQERDDYTLEMRLFEAVIDRGAPVVPQPVNGVTQYQDWAFDTSERLRAGAERGSLCCGLYLAF